MTKAETFSPGLAEEGSPQSPRNPEKEKRIKEACDKLEEKARIAPTQEPHNLSMILATVLKEYRYAGVSVSDIAQEFGTRNTDLPWKRYLDHPVVWRES